MKIARTAIEAKDKWSVSQRLPNFTVEDMRGVASGYLVELIRWGLSLDTEAVPPVYRANSWSNVAMHFDPKD